MEKYSELARCVENIEKDASKFFVHGNKAAGTRARKHLQELKQLAQDLRVIIQDTKNEKTRAPQDGNASLGQDDEHMMSGQPSAYDDVGNVGF